MGKGRGLPKVTEQVGGRAGLPLFELCPPLYFVQDLNLFTALGDLPAACHFRLSKGQIFAFPASTAQEHEHVTWIQPIISSPRTDARARLQIWLPLSFWFWNHPILFVTSANKNLLDKMSIRLKLNWSNPRLGLKQPLMSLQILGFMISYLEHSSEVDLNSIYFHCYLCLIIAHT